MVLERTAILVGMLLAVACGPVVKAVETPGPPATGQDEEIMLEAELGELGLGESILDPSARCGPANRVSSTLEASCFAPPELGLDEPGLRDPRREPGVSYLWSPDRYANVIAMLEHSLIRSAPRTRARRKILGWLTTAYDRWRATLHAWREHSNYQRPIAPSPCLIHYLSLLVGEVDSERQRGLAKYALAIELERAGKRKEAQARYEALARGTRRTPAMSLSHAALGDLAFRRSFCDESFLPVAYRHYLAAAHGALLPRFRVTAYARLRLGQLERELGALGSSTRQLDLAEAEGIYPGVEDLGPRTRRLRTLFEATLSSIAKQAVADGTLRLLTAFEPPSASFCIELERIAKRSAERPLDDQIRAALVGPCRFEAADEAKECAKTAGCSMK